MKNWKEKGQCFLGGVKFTLDGSIVLQLEYMDILHPAGTNFFIQSTPEPGLQVSLGRRLCRWWGAGAQKCMLSITSSLWPQPLSLCLQDNMHKYSSFPRHSLWGCDMQCNPLHGFSDSKYICPFLQIWALQTCTTQTPIHTNATGTSCFCSVLDFAHPHRGFI